MSDPFVWRLRDRVLTPGRPPLVLGIVNDTPDRIGRITPSGRISEFQIPTEESVPIAITSGRDRNLWFTEAFGNQIGRIRINLLPKSSAKRCVVPKLRGLTLAQANGLLHSAGCALGRVTRPATPPNGQPKVVGQAPAAKKRLPSGARVNVRLG